MLKSIVNKLLIKKAMLLLYILLILITFCWSISTINKNGVLYRSYNTNIKNKLLFLFIIMVFISTFRSSNLNDYHDYVRIFTVENLVENRYEPGDVFVINLIRLFSDNERVFFFIFALGGVGIKLFTIYRYSPSFFISVLIYLTGFFVLLDMIQVRNSIAISFFLLAVIYRSQEKWKKFLICAILSLLFHYSAILVFLLAFFHPNKNLFYYKWIIPLSYVVVWSGKTIGFLAGYLPGPYQLLFEDYLINHDGEIINLYNSVMLMRILFFYLIYHFFSQIYKKYPFVGIMLKSYALSLSLYVLTSDFPSIASRVNTFFASVEILLLPSLIYVRKWKTQMKFLIYIFCLGYFIVFYIQDSANF